MKANELMARYGMAPHVEHGSFLEKHPPCPAAARPASGLMYYYVAPDERTQFHRIDCDEYWCYAAGSPLELWQVTPQGKLSVSRLGVEQDCEPVIFVPQGTIFAARGLGYDDGTFLSCITVPRFQRDALTLFSREEMLGRCPALARFYD